MDLRISLSNIKKLADSQTMKDKTLADRMYQYYLHLKRLMPYSFPLRRSPYLRLFFVFAICSFVYVLFPKSTNSVELHIQQRIIHFDLKGAPPKLEYFQELFPFIKSLGFNTILMEYEDMFPYSGDLKIFQATNAYSRETLKEILKLADDNDLEIIPLIQTFGHLQFALKHSKYSHLREVNDQTDTICPSDPESFTLIQEMLQQVRGAHPKSNAIHIGCDEAWNIAKDERCKKKLQSNFGYSLERLKLSHIQTVAKFAKDSLGFETILAWDDLLRKIPANLLKEYEIGEYILPIIWNYDSDVTQSNKFPDGMFDRYTKIFPKIIFGSVFKGADNGNSTFVDVNRYFSNLKSFYKFYNENENQLIGRIHGIALTGWQRFWHGIELCEILPEGIPSLSTEAVFIDNPSLTNLGVAKKVYDILNCQPHELTPIKFNNSVYTPRNEEVYASCKFPGSNVYGLIEKLRFLQWKIKVIAKPFINIVKYEQNVLREEFRQAMSKYFYDDAVEEFIKQNIDSLIPDTPLPAVLETPNLNGAQ